MKRLIAFVLLIILAGCGTGVPDVDGTDWCYKFDFTQSDHGFNIVEGSWVEGSGLLTDGEGDLIFSYVHDRFVAVQFVIVTVRRAAPGVENIVVSAAGDIFGASASFSTTLPAGISTYPAVFQPDTIGIEGNSINVTAQASHPLYLESIEMRGMGGSPFGINICDDSQPLTPSTDTPTPEFTYTPTITASATLTRTATTTPTPTATPEGEWCYFWDFELSDGDWLAQPGRGVYVPGEGWGSESPPNNLLSIYYEFDTEIDLSQAIVNWSVAKEPFSTDRLAWDYHSNVPSDGSLSDTGIISRVENFNLHTDGSAELGAADDVKSLLSDAAFIGFSVTQPPRMRSVTIRGPGSLPMFLSGGVECDPEPTPTPTATHTPGTPTAAPTATPAAGWTCTFDFQNNNGGWASIFNAQWGLSVDDVGAWRAQNTSPNNSLGIRYASTGGVMPLSSIRIKGRTFGTRTDDEHELNFRTYYTSWTTFTQDSHDNTSFDETYSFPGLRYTTRIEVYLTVTQTTVDPTQIDMIQLQGVGGHDPCNLPGTATATAASTLTPSGTGTGTLTPQPLLTGTPRPATRTPVVVPPIATFLFTPGTPETGTPEGTPTPDPNVGPGEVLVGGSGGGFGTGWSLFGVIRDWVELTAANVNGMFGAFADSPPLAIPGLPLCMTAPLEHDLCAIYYILDWTLFAPNTPGVLIVPLLLLLMNFYMFVNFVRWVLKIIRLAESLFNVN